MFCSQQLQLFSELSSSPRISRGVCLEKYWSSNVVRVLEPEGVEVTEVLGRLVAVGVPNISLSLEEESNIS